MAVGLATDPQVDLDRLDAGSSYLPVPQSERYREELGHFDLANRALQFGKHLVLDTLGIDPADPVSEGNSLGTVDSRLPSELANDRYGVDGYLRFNQPTTAEDAAWMNSQAQERRYRDTVLAASRPTPLRDLGVGLTGALTDPVGLGLMATTGALGDAALGAVGLGDVAETGITVAKLGKVGNAAANFGFQAAKGAAYNAPYVAASGALANYAGDDYSLGDSLRDIAAGAIFHLGGHYGGKLVDGLLGRPALRAPEGRAEPDRSSPAGTPPDAVTALPPVSRAGAFAKALDDVASDRPVDVGQYVERELSPPTLARLDEPTADPAIASFRPLDDARAVTTRGTEVPVRYGLAELRDLTTSHDDNLQVNQAYPPELQPRARERAGAQARNYQLESELNPKLLMNDVSAAGGAPIVSPGGVVESGNGRTIALRRSAEKGGEAYDRYKAELAAQGFDTAGMDKPVLIRMRTQPMEGAQRAGLAREMNADVTERMSATEQAMSDAQTLDPATLQALGDETPAGRRKFARAFLSRVAPDQVNQLVAPDGALSKAGQDRIDAALVAKAYGDPRLVEALFEAADPNIKAIGSALKDAAPAWASMRASIEAGETPAGLDVTDALRSAIDLVRHARDEKIPVGELIMERLGQVELFGGEAIGPETEAFLRLFFRDERFSRPLGADKLSAALADYARRAEAFTPGPDLFGATPDVSTAREILGNLAARFVRDDPGDLDLRAPGRASDSGEAAAARPPVIDLREPGGQGDGADGGVSPDAGGGAEGSGAGDTAPTVLDEATLRARLSALGDDLGKLGKEVAGQAETALRSGGKVTLYIEGKPHEILSVEGGKMRDAEGLPWGVQAFLQGRPGDGDHIEISPSKQVARTVRLTGDQLIAADPELKALAEDTDRLAAENGLKPEPEPENQQPNSIAEALRAAAVCLAGEL